VILVVDDDPPVPQVLEHVLAREGFRVVTATGGVEGLRLARALRPAAITLDVLMPDLDGWTVLAALKGDPELADIPVLLLTIVDDRHRGYSLGAIEYLVKPVERTRLLRWLRAVCPTPAGRVLVVEDSDPTRALIGEALSREGWAIDEAANGRVGLERVRRARPDAIVLDLMMPEMDGFEFLAELRRHPEWRRIPVLVVTAMDLTEEDRRRLNGGVARVVQKNALDTGALLSEVSDWLASGVGAPARRAAP
jgi:CheY-like chemotaxis protein